MNQEISSDSEKSTDDDLMNILSVMDNKIFNDIIKEKYD